MTDPTVAEKRTVVPSASDDNDASKIAPDVSAQNDREFEERLETPEPGAVPSSAGNELERRRARFTFDVDLLGVDSAGEVKSELEQTLKRMGHVTTASEGDLVKGKAKK